VTAANQGRKVAQKPNSESKVEGASERVGQKLQKRRACCRRNVADVSADSGGKAGPPYCDKEGSGLTPACGATTLVIVESPQARTISRTSCEGFSCRSVDGHVRESPQQRQRDSEPAYKGDEVRANPGVNQAQRLERYMWCRRNKKKLVK